MNDDRGMYFNVRISKDLLIHRLLSKMDNDELLTVVQERVCNYILDEEEAFEFATRLRNWLNNWLKKF